MPTVEGAELREQASSSSSIEDLRLNILHKKSLSESHELQEGQVPKASKVDLKSIEVSNNFKKLIGIKSKKT